jgi:4-nitrophenyl phosphatase
VAAEEAEFVVVGVDVGLTYAKLADGLTAMGHGARLIVANLDRVFPIEDGLRPGAGAIVGAFHGMGFEPDAVCGKPNPLAIERAFELRGMPKDKRLLMIGDQLETDILGAERVGVDSVLVLTGASTEADVDRQRIRPTYVVKDLSELESIVRGAGAA